MFAVDNDSPCIDCQPIYLKCRLKDCEKMKKKEQITHKCPKCRGKMVVKNPKQDMGKSGYVLTCVDCGQKIVISR